MAELSAVTNIADIQKRTRTKCAAHLINPLTVDIPDFDHQVFSNEYGFYCTPKEFMGREVPELLCQGEVYEPKTLALMRRIVGTGDIVSGGGFIGDFFPALSKALAPNAILHSFEPNPISHSAALRTIALNRLTNVALANVAVGEEQAVLPLRVSRGKNEAMAARAKIVSGVSNSGTINVEVTTLDALIDPSRTISVLHLDIEGHELPALKGAANLILRCKPIIILEAARPRMRRMYKQALRHMFPTLKYDISGRVERNCVYRPNGL